MWTFQEPLMNCSWTIFFHNKFMNCDGELFMNFSSWTNNANILWTFHELFMNVHEQFIKSWTTFHRGVQMADPEAWGGG